jgi:hypothetical protein
MSTRPWVVTFSEAFDKERARHTAELAAEFAYAGLMKDPTEAAAQAERETDRFLEFLDAIGDLIKPRKGPDTLPVAFDEHVRVLSSYRRLEVRPWIAYFLLDLENVHEPHAFGVIFFHEDDAPTSLRAALKMLQ